MTKREGGGIGKGAWDYIHVCAHIVMDMMGDAFIEVDESRGGEKERGILLQELGHSLKPIHTMLEGWERREN